MRGDHKRERDQEAGREMGNQREGQPERHFVARESPPATIAAAGWPFNGRSGLS